MPLNPFYYKTQEENKMYAITEGAKKINGVELQTFSREVKNAKTDHEVEAGTTGCKGGCCREKGARSYLSIGCNQGDFLFEPTVDEDGRCVGIEILHIPGLGFDGIIGYSPIALEKNAIGLGIASEEYGSKFFSNGARPSGILTHPNTVKNPKAVRESWNSAYGSFFISVYSSVPEMLCRIIWK